MGLFDLATDILGGGATAVPVVSEKKAEVIDDYTGAADASVQAVHPTVKYTNPIFDRVDELRNVEALQYEPTPTLPYTDVTSQGVSTGLSETQRGFRGDMTDAAQSGSQNQYDIFEIIKAMKGERQEQGPETDYAELYKQMIDQGAGYLEPYREAGSSALSQMMQKQQEGDFDPGQFSYSGQPIDRSIESYMQDSPELAWQQEQLQRQIDRSGAAQGRWGGGGTAREMMREQQGLLSQDYGNRFNRAAMERGADVGAEQNMYNRALQGYGLDANRMAQDFSRLSGVAGMGERAATSTGGMYSGLGSQLLGQQHQQSMFDQQLAEQRRLADAAEQSSMWSGLGSILGGGLGMFLGGPAGAAAGYQLGNTAGGMVD